MMGSMATDTDSEATTKPAAQEIQMDVALRAVSEILFSPRRVVVLPDYLSNHEELGRIIDTLLTARAIIFSMANGDFSCSIPLKGFLGGSLKALQAHLNHLTWQTKMVAQGDFSQRVDFMGEFSESFNAMVVQLEEAHKKLAESEVRYRSFFSSAEAIKLIINPEDGRIIDANLAATEFFGHEHDAMLSQSIHTMVCLPKEKFDCEMQRARETGKGSFFSRYHAASGEYFDLEVHTSPFFYGEVELLMFSIQDITERKKMQDKLQVMATTDSLTGLNNRFQFMILGRLRFETARRSKRPLAVVMFDIDHFKRVNDTFGHDAGDLALKCFSRIALETFRSSDVLGRLGGEEFAVIMTNTSGEQALMAMERFREAIEKNTMTHEGKTFSITVSSGIALFTNTGLSLEMLLKQADQALYKAKNSGRNRTELA